ncbi:MAG: pseudouridylate synthase [Bacteroidales bacterium]|jgi:predicted hotdog family 3-hydroxylacyl-ACP dehydratase|nr:pseudouridylate synthase [Bacteroidales bacterium]
MKKVENTDILELLPQRRPFVMIDRITHFDLKTISTVLKIEEENIFVEKGFLSEAGIIESIAQTCAARMGYINKYLLKDSLKLGFIGSIKQLVIEKLPKVNEEIAITVDVKNEIFSVTLVTAVVRCENETLASCEMKIFLTDINSK